jgi:sugar/nucleoside kinase (ribokinase family)
MIASLGELLVEFVCATKDGHNRAPATYAGPFPSGAPGIFIDQAARIAGRAIFAGAVGADAFGQVVLHRLLANGVLPDLILTDPDRPTGTAHVAYNSDGSRDFVFNIAHSAAAHLPDAATIQAGFLRQGVSVLHISGSALGDPAMRARIVAVADGPWALSIDPNIRPELLRDAGYLTVLRDLIARAAFVLPSDADAELLWPGEAFADWAPRLITSGARAVMLKRGDKGCLGTDGRQTIDLPAHAVTVVDPTGAGDCFCGTFVALMDQGRGLPDAMTYANAAGALSVQSLGPMEGNAPLDRIARLAPN